MRFLQTYASFDRSQTYQTCAQVNNQKHIILFPPQEKSLFMQWTTNSLHSTTNLYCSRRAQFTGSWHNGVEILLASLELPNDWTITCRRLQVACNWMWACLHPGTVSCRQPNRFVAWKISGIDDVVLDNRALRFGWYPKAQVCPMRCEKSTNMDNSDVLENERR